MPAFRELLAKVKQKITEVDPAEAESRLGDATFLDVRELDEFEQGTVPGAVFIPRGHLESQVEGKLPEKDRPVVVYCAGGTRSAFAAETLGELGYSDVASLAGGFGRWKNEGRQRVAEHPRHAVPSDRGPTLVVDAAVAEHLEVLRLASLGRIRVVEAVGHAHAVQRHLLDAVHERRLRQPGRV